MFSRVLVANRGEIAVRVIRAIHELGAEAVAVYSTADRDALHVRLAERSVCIGPPAAAESYLRIPNVIAAAETTGCEAVHPGYGFLSENPAFVRACEEHDLVFVGPGADVMERMGDKARAKAEMRAADVPLVPGTEGGASLDEMRAAAAELGFPVLLKAVSGGGGKGMRLVQSLDELERAYSTAGVEAEAAFSDGSLYLEKALVPARHVEVQVLCDRDGGVLTLGERECSIQRRHQKLVEESPSPALDDATREAMEAATERACRTIGYENAGTFEFLLGADGTFHFMELNARLQVEHPVSELVTGIDLVREQLRVAAGEPLDIDPRFEGHSVEARLYAEDPKSFLPQAGRIERLRLPTSIRVDAGVAEGDEVGVAYDPMIAKLIAHGPTRDEALLRLRDALAETTVEGLTTNLPFLRWLVAHPVIRAGRATTAFLSEYPPLSAPPPRLPSGPWDGAWRLNLPAPEPQAPPDVDELAHARTGASGGEQSSLTAPMPGTVIKVFASPGDKVEHRQTLLVLEAMKMETPVVSPYDGTVRAVHVSEGDRVAGGTLLVELED